ncbi:MAG: hypothetical protein D4R64_13850 [Porphyromonadaceae bacterium]|nr:MAG: hypothetical protein D4R64_13850 [Porphyromonadaceae bacterium]
MISKKMIFFGILIRRLFMPPIEKLILKNILKKGRTYPGDVVKDLGISQTPGMKKILELKRKGYLIRDDNSSLMRINPAMRKIVKIMTG